MELDVFPVIKGQSISQFVNDGKIYVLNSPYTVIDYTSNATDMQAILLEKNDSGGNPTGEYVVAFRGTEPNSKETGIKLTNVARASLEELLEDYRDFLRTRGLRLWAKESREALFVRRLGRSGHRANGTDEDQGLQRFYRAQESYETYRPFIETRPPEVVANILICLIHQANYLLDRQLAQLEQAFLKEGGLRERMTRARLAARNKS